MLSRHGVCESVWTKKIMENLGQCDSINTLLFSVKVEKSNCPLITIDH